MENPLVAIASLASANRLKQSAVSAGWTAGFRQANDVQLSVINSRSTWVALLGRGAASSCWNRRARACSAANSAAGALPEGSYLHPEVSPDGSKILFAYCRVEKAPTTWNEHGDHYYHIYEVHADGSNLRQLTDGPFNDFSPKYLPNGQIIFVSTRRGGWHRCGGQPGEGCENHTLAVMNADGSEPHTISYHETQEWDPAVLDDGRVIFTRWDYVDRHAVHYEQLFTVRPDGSAAGQLLRQQHAQSRRHLGSPSGAGVDAA